jgi:F-type H+-transporting ATPase subunit b
MIIEISQIITQIISFLVMLWVLQRFAWKPLLKVMDERRHKIESDFKTIEEQTAENERLRKEYQEKLQGVDAEARLIIKEANEKGRHIFKEIESEARIQAKDIINKTREELQQEVVKAKVLLREEIVNMTLMATQKILQTNLDAEKQKKLVDEFVNQMETN